MTGKYKGKVGLGLKPLVRKVLVHVGCVWIPRSGQRNRNLAQRGAVSS